MGETEKSNRNTIYEQNRMRTLSAQLVNKVMHKTNTHIEVLPPSVYALRGIIFYTVAKINQNLSVDFL